MKDILIVLAIAGTVFFALCLFLPRWCPPFTGEDHPAGYRWARRIWRRWSKLCLACGEPLGGVGVYGTWPDPLLCRRCNKMSVHGKLYGVGPDKLKTWLERDL